MLSVFWDPFSWMYRSQWGSTPYRNRSRPRWGVCQWLITQQMAPADVGTFCDCPSLVTHRSYWLPSLTAIADCWGYWWITEASTYNPSNPVTSPACSIWRSRMVLPLCPGTCCQWLERLAGLAVIFDGCFFSRWGGLVFLKRFTFCKWRCSKTEVVKNKSLAYPIEIDQWWFTSASSTPEACLPCASLQTWPWDMPSARWRKCWGHLATDRIWPGNKCRPNIKEHHKMQGMWTL